MRTDNIYTQSNLLLSACGNKNNVMLHGRSANRLQKRYKNELKNKIKNKLISK